MVTVYAKMLLAQNKKSANNPNLDLMLCVLISKIPYIIMRLPFNSAHGKNVLINMLLYLF